MINTKRCILSEVQKSDYESVKQLWMDDQVRQYLGGSSNNESSLLNKFTDLFERSNKEGSVYLIAKLLENGNFIGLVSLDRYHDGENIEISYEFLPRYWGIGLATEIIRRVVLHAFEDLGLQQLVVETQTANVRSCALLERIGMIMERKINRFGAEQAVYYLKNP